MEKKSFTEQTNHISQNIDKIRDAAGIVRTLRAVDAQIFGGYSGEYVALGDLETEKVIYIYGQKL